MLIIFLASYPSSKYENQKYRFDNLAMSMPGEGVALTIEPSSSITVEGGSDSDFSKVIEADSQVQAVAARGYEIVISLVQQGSQ